MNLTTLRFFPFLHQSSQRFSSILLDGIKDGGAKNNMILNFENSGNSKMTGTKWSILLINAFLSIEESPDSNNIIKKLTTTLLHYISD